MLQRFPLPQLTLHLQGVLLPDYFGLSGLFGSIELLVIRGRVGHACCSSIESVRVS